MLENQHDVDDDAIFIDEIARATVDDDQLFDETVPLDMESWWQDTEDIENDHADGLVEVEGWDSEVIDDVVGGRGPGARARYQVLTCRRPRTTAGVTTYGALARAASATEKTSSKAGKKGASEDPVRAITRVIARTEVPGDGRLPKSEAECSATVTSPYGPQSIDRDRNEARQGLGAGVGASAATPCPDAGSPGAMHVGKALRDYVSMQAMASTSRRAIVGFDTEFCDEVDAFGIVTRRDIVSYQFATVDPMDSGMIIHVVVLPLDGVRLRVSTGLRLVVEAAGLWHHVAAPSPFGPGGVRLTAGRVWSWHDADGRRHQETTMEAAASKSAWPAEAEGLRASVTVRSGRGDKRGGASMTRRTGSWAANREGVGCGWEWSKRQFFDKRALSLQLVAHFGNADLSTFHPHDDDPDMMLLIQAGGGLVSDRPKWVMAKGSVRDRAYPIRVDVRDTMAHAPAGMGSLASLGNACGVPKIKLTEAQISAMRDYLADDPEGFMAYAANDAEICVEYVSRLWGEGYAVPLTLPAASAAALRDSACNYFGFEGRGATKMFNACFAGLQKVEMGLSESERDNQLTYYREKGMEPLNMKAGQYQHASAFSYRGGYNGCSQVGWISGKTYDHDLENAYPTAMALVPDLDFENGCIQRTVENMVMSPVDLPDPTIPFVGEVRFEFPEDVLYPCIPVPVEGSVIYPRTSDGLNGVMVQGPELWLALRLGARVEVLMGFFGRPLYEAPGEPSRSLRAGVRQLIDDRSAAKAAFGKKSLEELLFKTAVNSAYGKVAQQVSPNRSWNAMAQEMGEVAGSAVTSPHHAAMTTSLVRAMLLATMNQLNEEGFEVYSVTTDGFITDCPLDVLKAMDLYGLAPIVHEARVALTGNPQMWDVKHEQNGFLNGSTRLNISRSTKGVMAHGGFKPPAGMVVDSVEDRDHMHDLYVRRTARLTNSYRRFTPFSQLSKATERKDFLSKEISKRMGMDFDMKRRPVAESMTIDQVPDSTGALHEVARVRTMPWDSVAEARRGRSTGKAMSVLRTGDDWRLFFLRLEHGGTKGRRITDARRTILMSILIGHRRSSWDIPNLSGKRPRTWKLDWLSSWGLGTVTVTDWDNARRPERESQMIPREQCEPWLSAMLAHPEGQMPPPGGLEVVEGNDGAA